jgi:5-formaminoimidazole-4-carboxamide-1-(beta)-D-ribofuranosyl 5'-monophosphate synthetase
MKYSIATLASHSALQILKGAKEEGFHTIAICQKDRVKPYKSFGVADEYIILDSFSDYFLIEQELIKKNTIIIPHGSFVAYLGEKTRDIKAMHFGNKKILKWESDRKLERQWLTKAGLKMPRLFNNPEEINCPVIVKFDGAGGGSGYFIANNPEEFYNKIKPHKDKIYTIQEFIIGVPIYIHYYYSPLTNELEIMSVDKRYESNADGLGRLPSSNFEPSYTVTANLPLVLRESLLPEVFEMGEAVVKVSKELEPPGLYGPFCLETVMTPDLKFFVFEISARIVAGTNCFPGGSPYTYFKYTEPMSTGRRIARDINLAIKLNLLHKILG